MFVKLGNEYVNLAQVRSLRFYSSGVQIKYTTSTGNYNSEFIACKKEEIEFLEQFISFPTKEEIDVY